MKSPAAPTSRRAARGFTLLEMVSALGIMTIALAALTPPALRQLTRSFREGEQRKLVALGDALRSRVVRTTSIPGPTEFATELASEIGCPLGQVLGTPFGDRVVLFDDGFRVGPGPGHRPTYHQGDLGSVAPTNARVLILSSIGPSLPASLTTGFLDSATFANLWNTSPGQVPADWSWHGAADELLIQRVHLGNLFVRVIINSPTSITGRYSFNGGATNAVPSASFSTYVIKGTRVGFHGPDGTLQAIEIIDEPLSRTFAYASWRADAPGAAPGWLANKQLSGCDLQAAADHFLPSPLNSSSLSTPTDFVASLAGLLQAYLDYADGNFDVSLRPMYQNAQLAVKDAANELMR